MVRNKAWSPYAAGIIIGLLQIPALLLIGSALGASSSYVSVSAYIAGLIDPAIREIAYFDKYLSSLSYLWQASMVVSIGIGAFISSRLSASRRPSYSPIWQTAAGVSLRQRLGMAFLGGFILLFGARWAGGCTLGHGISGVGQLAVSSIVVVVCMFLGGMATANMMRRL